MPLTTCKRNNWQAKVKYSTSFPWTRHMFYSYNAFSKKLHVHTEQHKYKKGNTQILTKL